MTYTGLQRATWVAANGLRTLGVRPGDRVLMVVADELAFPVTFLAALRIGAVPVPVSTMLRAHEVTGLVADSLAKVVVASGRHLGLLTDAATGRVTPEAVVATHDGGRRDGAAVPEGVAVHRWEDFTDAAEVLAEPTTATSTALWLYTSGTTGTPKAAIHRHGDIQAVCDTYARSVLGIGADDVCYSVPKLFFAFGLGNALFFPLGVGASAVLDPDPPTPGSGRRAARPPPAHPVLRPTWLLRRHGRRRTARDRPGVGPGHRHRRRDPPGGGASPLHRPLRHRDARRHRLDRGPAHLLLEPSRRRPAGMDRPPGRRLSNCGCSTIAATRYQRRRQRREPCGCGGDSVAAGYWQRPDLTASTFVDGWLRTGDVYQRSADGYYRFIGRNSDMIKAGGIWVSPAEVEAVLLEHEDVLEAAVVGRPQRRRPGGHRRLRGSRTGPHGRPGRPGHPLPGPDGGLQAAAGDPHRRGPAQDRYRQDPALRAAGQAGGRLPGLTAPRRVEQAAGTDPPVSCQACARAPTRERPPYL